MIETLVTFVNLTIQSPPKKCSSKHLTLYILKGNSVLQLKQQDFAGSIQKG